jgi:hypothetical protein
MPGWSTCMSSGTARPLGSSEHGGHIYRKVAPTGEVTGRRSARPPQVSAAPQSSPSLRQPLVQLLLVWDNTSTSGTCGHPADPDLAYVEKRSELSPAAGGLRPP